MTENVAVLRRKGKGGSRRSKHRYDGCWRSGAVFPDAKRFSQFSSFLKTEVITMLHTLEEDIKPIVPSLIYISPCILLGNEFISAYCIFKLQRTPEGQWLMSRDSVIYRKHDILTIFISNYPIHVCIKLIGSDCT